MYVNLLHLFQMKSQKNINYLFPLFNSLNGFSFGTSTTTTTPFGV